MRKTAISSALVLPFVVACAGSSPPPSAPNDKLGEPVGFALTTDDGALVSVPIPGERATVVSFFGPACAACKQTIPAIQAKSIDIAKKGAKLVLVGVLTTSQTPEDAKRALASWGVTASFLVDKDGSSMREAGVDELPATMVLDPKGKIRWVAPPEATPDDVVAAAGQ